MSVLALDDHDALALGEGRVLVRDGFLPQLAEEAAGVLAAQVTALSPARLGKLRVHRPDLRGDHIAWLEDLPPDPASTALLAALEALGRTLSAELRLALGKPLVQVARFGPGTGYTRHRDTFRDDPGRRLTAILYLNAGWAERDGGHLRVWELEAPPGVAEPPGAGFRDILPVLGRLVLFRADAVEHEVLAPRRDRWAVTAWFGSPAVLEFG